jgi:hemolysin activation/secretion protein
VNIPEQTLQDGIVKLQVIESRIGRVKVTGNRYFTMEKVMKDLPSFTPGGILYLPDVQKEIGRLNRSQDIKVEPVMSPGKEVGTIDVELKVEDRLPLHGSLELNNRASSDTTDLRLNAVLHYDNLWQSEHSLSLQYQVSPQEPKEVEALGASYVLPAPWEKDDQFAFYGIWSDSKTAFGEGFKVTGRGKIYGMREVTALPPYKLYYHTLTVGVDYKDFKQAVGYTTPGGETTETPITYLPFSVAYSSSLPDEGGVTKFNVVLNLSFRGLVSKESEFELKRYKASANYYYLVASIQRNQKLPFGMGLMVKVDGQITDQPLIDNEQYIAGGMESVRGYKESEAAGDEAIHSMIELSFRDLFEKSGSGKTVTNWLQMTPYLFYDVASLTIHEPLPGQESSIRLEGAGIGVRGSMGKSLEYEMDWADALDRTDRTKPHTQRFYFFVKAVF